MNLPAAKHILESIKIEAIAIASKLRKHLTSAVILNSVVLIILFGTIGFVTTATKTRHIKDEMPQDLNLALEILNAQKSNQNNTQVEASQVTNPKIIPQAQTPIEAAEDKQEEKPAKQADIKREIEKIVNKIDDDSRHERRKRAFVTRQDKKGVVDILDNETARLNYLKEHNLKKNMEAVSSETHTSVIATGKASPAKEIKYYGVDSSVFIPFESDLQ